MSSTLGTGFEAEVTLFVDGQRQESQRVAIPAMGQAREVFYWMPEAIGTANVAIHVSPHADEVLEANNQAEVAVAIKEESLNVLVVESAPRWEYRYLRNALQRDPGVDVACVLFHPAMRLGGGSDYLEAFPKTDEELAKFDVVFLGDVGVQSGQLTDQDCRRILGLVESQASGLILMPGMRGNQQSLVNSPLKELYPVVLDAGSPKGFGSKIASHLLLTATGESSLLTKLADTPRENAGVWQSLPGVQWRSPATHARPGCDVLAIHEQSRAPMLVTKTYGTGKILFMGTDGAWRWRAGVEDKYHYRFWGQVARWMAYQRHMAQGKMLRVFYTPDRPVAGNTVTINATVLDPAGAPLRDATVTAQLVEPSGAKRQLNFVPMGDNWGLYSARYAPEQVGAHPLTVRCEETEAELVTELNVQGTEREVIGRPARPDVLAEVANISRGEMVAPDQMRRLCDLVLQLPPPEPTVRRLQIWSSPYWAATLLILMSVFWIGRKLTGAI